MTKPLLKDEFLQQLNKYERLLIGYSGGLDSTVLLHLLSTQSFLKSKLIAVHINHGLSPNAQKWQKHCQEFCKALHVSFIVEQVHLYHTANIEEAAREARYASFAKLMKDNDGLILAHHLNDQAETLLLQLIRGTGIDGLAGMAFSKRFATGKLLRPFLGHSRETLEAYANFHQLQWIDDESNENIDFSRNYLRHQVMPLLVSRWPKISNNFARTSEHCQQAQSNLDDLAKIDCPSLTKASGQLTLTQLKKDLSCARLTNVLRFWLKENQVKLPSTATFNRLITEVIEAKDDANPQITWENNQVRRYQETLYLLKMSQSIPISPLRWLSFPEPLNLGESLGVLHANLSDKGLVIPEKSIIEVRFRKGGETFFWHGQTKQLKKLFQEWQIPPWMREQVPLVYVDNQLACVVGYAISDCFYNSLANVSYQLSLHWGS
ncbi:tRNA lysidine(34) synthetase TilS [Legionella cardiaca]|uniref:tRNA(Ile)-lysidine synthase n=1 Tax=Legionella cardiaca TaxID=1071983 RepID=A0ABY8AY35_9GAMM|nr:tRNA lysidine(34) synthetase TilS [Legionella cardiaca]WED44664.1 tRNA lysidine(34) synthetase TilS [Legionella cardiaca]